MGGKVIVYAFQNQGVDTSKYSMPSTQFANGVINLNFDQKWDTGMSWEDIDEHILGLLMANQYSLKKGVEIFENCGQVAAIKELRQIHDMET